MARRPRVAAGGIAYHVMNRTWGGVELFADVADYQAFERVLAEARKRFGGMRLCAYCLLPNHYHLVLWPARSGLLSRFMQWLGQTHAARWHAHRHSPGRGHLYQGRFRSFPIQQDEHFLKVCRYVERNALRAGLARRAENWRWNSLCVRHGQEAPTAEALDDWPVTMPRNWIERVNRAEDPKELAALRLCRERGRPFGDSAWTADTARRLRIESTLRPVGRPRKAKAGEKS